MTSCAGEFEVENAFVDVNDAVDERHLHIETGLGDDADRLSEPHHQRLLGLIDGEECAVADDDGDQQQNGDGAAGEAKSHWPPPDDAPLVDEVPGNAERGRGSSVSGK